MKPVVIRYLKWTAMGFALQFLGIGMTYLLGTIDFWWQVLISWQIIANVSFVTTELVIYNKKKEELHPYVKVYLKDYVLFMRKECKKNNNPFCYLNCNYEHICEEFTLQKLLENIEKW